MIVCEHIKAKGKPEFTPLVTHLQYVSIAIEKAATAFGLDSEIARHGAILHDIGKASTIFQERISPGYKRKEGEKPYRHELASLFFLSLFKESMHVPLVEMIVAHHKSLVNDPKHKGMLDLEQNFEDVFSIHKKDWPIWSKDALLILASFGIHARSISEEEAEDNYYKALDISENLVISQGYSKWKGLLVNADHFASALIYETETQSKKLFQKPNLSFFERQHELYPLSSIGADAPQKHTMVVASTGSGKTDFLFRRCRNRVFYTLPFQASINAMYNRLVSDLTPTNPDVDIRLLHSASSVAINKGKTTERVLQGLMGSSIKVLTPHQIAGIIFGTRGFEATILDLQGNDIILDEIHTYTEISRAIVIKMVEVLNKIDCRIHVGTATMPSDLYDRIVAILGKDNVYEVRLPDEELDKFDRHIIHKLNQWEDADNVIRQALNENKKVLVVCNRVKSSQERYSHFKEEFPEIPSLVIHSRFKRGDRNEKEQLLIGLDREGKPTHQFNTSDKACIVVATQVVEVSLDISFDLMVTETAPLDAMIQRFGRVNRKRTSETIGKYKPIYLIPPPEVEKEALPYDLKIIKSSFDVLPDRDLLKEREMQAKINSVFPQVEVMNIETHSIFKKDGSFILDYLTHRPKSYLLELLEIDSVSCILESDIENYTNGNFEQHLQLEVPARYWQVKAFPQCDYGNRPFMVPDHAYSKETGFHIEKAREPFTQKNNFL